MKRFHFRLEKVLQLKRQQDRLAESRQLHARRVWEAARSEVEFLLQRLAQSAAAVEEQIGRPIAPDFWIAQYQHMTQVRLAVDAAETKANRAMTALDEANRLRRISAAELESLQLLRQQKWQEHRRETARLEQQRLDDVYLHRDRFLQSSTTTHESDGRVSP